MGLPDPLGNSSGDEDFLPSSSSSSSSVLWDGDRYDAVGGVVAMAVEGVGVVDDGGEFVVGTDDKMVVVVAAVVAVDDEAAAPTLFVPNAVAVVPPVVSTWNVVEADLFVSPSLPYPSPSPCRIDECPCPPSVFPFPYR